MVGLTSFNFLFVLHRVGPGLNSTLSRGLASVPAVDKSGPEFQTPLIGINCAQLKKLKNISTKAPTARIKMSNCDNIKSIVNTTNRNQADLFPLSAKEWTSDFIFLNHGSNQLVVHLSGKDYVIEITREKEKLNSPKAL